MITLSEGLKCSSRWRGYLSRGKGVPIINACYINSMFFSSLWINVLNNNRLQIILNQTRIVDVINTLLLILNGVRKKFKVFQFLTPLHTDCSWPEYVKLLCRKIRQAWDCNYISQCPFLGSQLYSSFRNTEGQIGHRGTD